MLSPYKLYKHDMQNQRVARTWGPKGKPMKGTKGSTCYVHKNVDWTVHRLTPAIYERAPQGSHRRTLIEKGLSHPKIGAAPSVRKEYTKDYLTHTSPRWGEGKVPGRMEGRKVVPLPTHGVEVNKSTKVAVGAAGVGAAAYGGYKLHQHFHQQHERETTSTPPRHI